MTICPIALVAGCRKCLIVKACPLKGVIGDYKEPDESQPEQHTEQGSGGAGKDK